MRLALAQLSPLVGAVARNALEIRQAYEAGNRAGADVVVTGELALTGYPPEDLVLKPAFLDAVEEALVALAAGTGQVPLVIGFVERLRDDVDGIAEQDWRPVSASAPDYPPLANAAAVCRNGRVEAVYRKQRLPNYGVFDEVRYFRAGTQAVVFDAGEAKVGVTVCEDLWGEGGPLQQACGAGARLVVNLNASPYHRGKRSEREEWVRRHAQACDTWIAYVNQVGGQDEVVFDGDSFVQGPDGEVAGRGAQFDTDLLVVDVPVGRIHEQPVEREDAPRLDPLEEIYRALVLGTRDYVDRNGFPGAIIGISGGIDSALVAALACDALGGDRVIGVAMPSPYSSEGSLVDAKQLADNLGMRYLELPIADAMKAFDEILAEPFSGLPADVTEENIQARIRGVLAMALSNKLGHIVLTTGNKSEGAVGYSTLYGDMAGGFAPIKDVPKKLVYELCRHRNAVAGEDVIPRSTIDKPPSAELRPDQRDSDSLPDYDILDPIVEAYVERDRSVQEIVAMGFDEEDVRGVIALIDRAEFKRRQAPPGIKIGARAFGKDRRMPITQGWTG
jgi:NAD+ synthase (glutamine-hydrolysing)